MFSEDFVGGCEGLGFGGEAMEIRPVLDARTEAESSSSKEGILHHVSNLDTLPGLAIKYGVELFLGMEWIKVLNCHHWQVADIKRLNGLATDSQMYARRILRIPLYGRHPPSELQRDTQKTSFPRYARPRPHLKKQLSPSFSSPRKESYGSSSACSDSQDVEGRKLTSAMCLLQGYYGLSAAGKPESNGTKSLLYQSDADAHSEEEPFTPPFTPPHVCRTGRTTHPSSLSGSSPQSSGWTGYHGKDEQREEPSGSLTFENGSSSSTAHHATDSGVPEPEKSSEKVVRRRTKVEGWDGIEGNGRVDYVPVDLFLAAGKSPAPRPKAQKNGTEIESEVSAIRLLPFTWGSSIGTPTTESSNESKSLGVLLGGMVRSVSTSNLQDAKKASQGNSPYKSGSRELDAPSPGPMLSITRPLLEGLVKPSSRRNKTALD